MDIYNSSLKELNGFFVMVLGGASLVGCRDVFACELTENQFSVAFLFIDTFGNSQYLHFNSWQMWIFVLWLVCKTNDFFSKYRNVNNIYRPNSVSKNSVKY